MICVHYKDKIYYYIQKTRNDFKANAQFRSRIILPVRLQSYINLIVVSVHRMLNPLVKSMTLDSGLV